MNPKISTIEATSAEITSAETASANDQEFLNSRIQKLGLEHIQRHILICADPSKPICCSQAEGVVAWDYLKRRLQDLKLDVPQPDRPSCVFRTKANCLRVCTQGPILVVYPDGVWYRATTPEVIERIIQEHLLNNQIVEEYLFLTHPLPQIQPTID